MNRTLIPILLWAGLVSALAAGETRPPAEARVAYGITVTAAHRDYREVPVSVLVPAPDTLGGATLVCSQARNAVECRQCQVAPEGERVRVTWILRDLPRGQSRRYQLTLTPGPVSPPPEGVTVVAEEGAVQVNLDGELFTRYLTATGPKPICWPMIGPTGKPVTRAFPMEQVEGESQDHPHHRSFWFTHDEVNGVNFWGEGSGCGRQVHRAFEALESGPVYGLIRTRNDWLKPEGTKVCEDTRELRVYRVANGRLFDFTVTLRATAGPVEIGDTKEGTLGFRVASSMDVDRGQGHIVNARGKRDGEAWGQQAEWCDYSGPVEGETVGIAILEHPTSFRHPTYWHVRTYGLFAANPFGLRHFIGDPTGAGKYTIPAGESITFRYRVFLHRGDAEEARVADVYGEYVDPPVITVGN